ncbi:MAG: amidohydrolase [Gemmatimonadota bacterium]
MHARPLVWALALTGLWACASARPSTERARTTTSPDEPSQPFASTYVAPAAPPTLLRNATVLTAAGPLLENASVLLEDGRVAAVGIDVAPPPGARIVDATGRWITPGIIDVHSHLGVYPAPGVEAVSDGNEATDPNTAEVWAEHSIWPQDPQFALARAGGVTSLRILPGSANLFGGRGVTLKNVPSRTVQGLKFPGAPHSLKMACGENPKRVYGEDGKAPSTRMGNVAGYRAAWTKAGEYRAAWERWRDEGAEAAAPPARDLELETLAGVLDGRILVQNHCYRADEMAIMLDVAREAGYRIATFEHAVEAYKIRDLLAENGVCASMWADWWGFKIEAYDGIEQNVALVDEAGGCAIVHSDSESGIQRLNQEAAKAMQAGREAGIDVDREDAIRWITINPARALGVAERTGSLEPGKMADVVVWSADPFSVYARADLVFVDGVLLHDRAAAGAPESDWLRGLVPAEVGR